MVGAAGWRLEYQAPLPERMHTLHTDRDRLRWIHSLMIAAMMLTPAGLAAVAGAADQAGVWIAAAAYGLGSVPWLLNLTFRLTVQERAAERTAAGEEVPDWYPALEAWAGLGHRVHMLASYASAVPLAWGLAEVGLIPDWLAWSGAIWGIAWSAGYAIRRTRFAFEPPFWAHVFTLAVGIALL